MTSEIWICTICSGDTPVERRPTIKSRRHCCLDCINQQANKKRTSIPEKIKIYNARAHAKRRAAGIKDTRSERVKKREYGIWCNMIYRCCNSQAKGYENYGGRGIKVCKEWRESFDAFFLHVGVSPTKEHSLDRIDNNGNYEPGNVRWATQKEQRRNSRQNVFVDVCGRKLCTSDAAKLFGKSRFALSSAVRKYGRTHQQVVDRYISVYGDPYAERK